VSKYSDYGIAFAELLTVLEVVYNPSVTKRENTELLHVLVLREILFCAFIAKIKMSNHILFENV
jgi:hypothetical protein